MTSIVVNPRLDYFSKPPLNITNHGYVVTVSDPASAPVQDAPINFTLASDNAFLNFEESLLRFKIKLTLPNGDDLPANMSGHVGFIPNIFHSIFHMVKVCVNDMRVSPSNDLYAYKAYFDSLFSKTTDSKHIDELSGGGFQ